MIPKIFHQVWVGPYRIPTREAGFISSLKSLNPGFDHFLWVDKNKPKLSPEAEEVFAVFGKEKSYAFQADILRIAVVFEYGGVYLDVDHDPISAFDEGLLRGSAMFHGNLGNDPTLSNAFFGAEKGHPLLAHMLKNIRKDVRWYGPHWVSAMIRGYYGLPLDCNHSDVSASVKPDGVVYIHSSEAQGSHIRHQALYSWSAENREKFSKGDYL